LITIKIFDIRDYTDNKHKKTDDYPFGGGAGMLMLPQPIFDCMEDVTKRCKSKPRRIYMSPSGKLFDNQTAKRLSNEEELIILCGHYEGIDQRVIDNIIDEEISIGDYILTGGEIAAMALVDSVARFVPNVLGSDESAAVESFQNGLLEYPQYTRPADFRGLKVPEVLLGGNHAEIEKWRRRQALKLTKTRRPDLLEKAELGSEDLQFLNESD
jgi:tRNA (guanine37-N1)-methyltransferase